MRRHGRAGGLAPDSTTLIVSGEQTRAEAMLVSGSYFAVLGAVPQLGRVIEPADDEVSSVTAVISQALWRSAFGGDPACWTTGHGQSHRVRRSWRHARGLQRPFRDARGHLGAMAAAMRDTPGWNHDAFRNFVSIIARVEAGEEVAASTGERALIVASRSSASTAEKSRPPNGASPTPSPASRSSSSSSGSRTRRRCCSCAAPAAAASRPSGRPSGRPADGFSPACCSKPRSSASMATAGALVLACGSARRSGGCCWPG